MILMEPKTYYCPGWSAENVPFETGSSEIERSQFCQAIDQSGMQGLSFAPEGSGKIENCSGVDELRYPFALEQDRQFQEFSENHQNN